MNGSHRWGGEEAKQIAPVTKCCRTGNIMHVQYRGVVVDPLIYMRVCCNPSIGGVCDRMRWVTKSSVGNELLECF